MSELIKVLKTVKEKTNRPITLWDSIVASILGVIISSVWVLFSQISWRKHIKELNKTSSENTDNEEGVNK